MCGVIGGWIPTAKVQPDFRAGLNKLAHRGPNDSGLECWAAAGGEVILGHTRLSIIDLSAAGHQPMQSRCGRYAIVFNGEIYNYRELRRELQQLGHHFVSDSDTEVLLASWITWGNACLARLRGMFAFVVYDKASRQLTCVRDAFGIKPFFYRLDEDGFNFASEVPALLALKTQRQRLNLQRAYDYIVAGRYDDRAETFFDGVKQLLPGHVMTLDLEAAVVAKHRRWWWPSIAERTDLSFADASEQLRAMFLDNIRLHLRSDVPLGAALSGGVDSSAVVCAMRHVKPEIPIHTFTYVARGSDADEESWADLVNNHVDATPHKVQVSPDELVADIDDMIRAQGEPFGSTSIYAQYRVFKLARANGVTVTLDGQGADELLAGYAGYPGPSLHSYIDRGEFVDSFNFLRAWSQWPGRSMSYGAKALIGQLVPNSMRGLALKIVGRDPAPAWMNKRIFKEHGVLFAASDWSEHAVDSDGRRLVAALRKSLTGQGLNALLRHGDRNSMRWSVESRVPFLTTEMAEFLLSLPEHYLVSREGETKYIFRAAMRGIVPNAILDRKDKIGFATPEQAWLSQLGSKVFEWLESADNLSFLNAADCRSEVESIIGGQQPFDFRAWRLINYCRWAQISEVTS
jgi:asparagine synthase (glutamine-hydrolysing)